MFRYFSYLLFSVIFFGFSFSVNAQSDEAKNTEDGFDIGHMIMTHIKDDYGYEITHKLKVPLPVMIYSKDEGVKIFSSTKINDGKVYEGFKAEDGKLVKLNEDGSVNENASFFDFSITKNVAAIMFSAALIFLLFISVAKGYQKNRGKAPKGIQSLLEPLIIWLRDEVVKPVIGPKYERFFPYLLTLFFFIFINNVLGLFPAGPNVTGNIAVTMLLAVVTFFIVNLSGNKNYWKHLFLPDVPKWMYVIMVPVEIVGVIMKPLSLMIRLFANITAGHIIMLSLYGLIFIFKSYAVGGGVSAFALFMTFVELLVAFIQALIFTLLTAMYIESAVAEPEPA